MARPPSAAGAAERQVLRVLRFASVTFFTIFGAAVLCGLLGALAAFCGWLIHRDHVNRQRARIDADQDVSLGIRKLVDDNPFGGLMFQVPYCQVCKRMRRGRVPRRQWREWKRMYQERMDRWRSHLTEASG